MLSGYASEKLLLLLTWGIDFWMISSQEDYILFGIVIHNTVNADVVYILSFYYLNGLDVTTSLFFFYF